MINVRRNKNVCVFWKQPKLKWKLTWNLAKVATHRLVDAMSLLPPPVCCWRVDFASSSMVFPGTPNLRPSITATLRIQFQRPYLVQRSIFIAQQLFYLRLVINLRILILEFTRKTTDFIYSLITFILLLSKGRHCSLKALKRLNWIVFFHRNIIWNNN